MKGVAKKIFIALFFAANLLFAQSVSTIDLLKECAARSISVYWDELTRAATLVSSDHEALIALGSNIALLDSDNVLRIDEPLFKDGALCLTDKSFNAILKHLTSPPLHASGFKISTILIDPGHGGKDPGAFGTFKISGKQTKVQEKNVVLATAKHLANSLRKAYPSKKIILTRESDKFLTLDERTQIANNVKLGENEAVLYVSIHANASLDKKATGYETWYLSPGYRRTVLNKDAAQDDKTLFPILNSMMEEEYTTESILMSKFIMDGLKGAIGDKSKARGIKAEEWFVVRNSNMPASLVEVGFVTNEKEATLLNTDAYLRKIADGISSGVQAFVTHFEKSRGFTATVQ